MKTIQVPLTLSEITYILCLLEGEKETGDYWGDKDRHYKRRDSLYDKLTDIEGEHEGKN